MWILHIGYTMAGLRQSICLKSDPGYMVLYLDVYYHVISLFYNDNHVVSKL